MSISHIFSLHICLFCPNHQKSSCVVKIISARIKLIICILWSWTGFIFSVPPVPNGWWFLPDLAVKTHYIQWSTYRAMWFGLILEDFKIIYKKTKKNHRLFVYQAIWHYSYARLPWYLILFTPSWIPQQVLPSFDIIYINPFLYFRFVDYVLCDSSGTAVRGWFYIIIF